MPSSTNDTDGTAQRGQAGVIKEDRSLGFAKELAPSATEVESNPMASSDSNPSKPGVTFASENKLPKLPIPDLEATCKRYEDALLPLQSSKEHRDTIQAVEEFLRSDGPKLQQKLKQYAGGKSSYIEQFCQSSRFMACLISATSGACIIAY